MTVDWARLGQAGCLLAFAVLIGRLLASGQMGKYMAPALDPLSAVTALVLAAMATREIRASVGRARPETHGGGDDKHLVAHGAGRVELILTALVILAPVGLGLVVTPRALGSGALGGEQIDSLLLTYAADAAPASGSLPTGSAPPVLDDMSALLGYLRRVGEVGAGQRVRVTGMVALSDALAPNELAILRYAIVHCVADARPLALLVVAPGRVDLTGDQWIEVEGVVAVRERGGDRLVAITAERITPTEEPANPYLPARW